MDPRQPTIKKFFEWNDAEATGKLESSDCINLEEADKAGMSGAAAGVGTKSKAGPSQLSEERNCNKTTKYL